MQAANAQTLLDQALRSSPPQALEVGMDEAKIVFFAQTQGIGTRNLNSCTVTIILSPHAAIMAHIAPNSLAGAAAGTSSLVHVQAIMEQALAHLTRYKAYFPAQSTSCIISASPDGGINVPLDHQRDLMRNMLIQRGLTVSTATYHIPISDVAGLAKGMAFLTIRPGRPTLYIADQVTKTW